MWPEHQSGSLKDRSMDPREQEVVWGGKSGLGENIRVYGAIRTPFLDLSPRYQWDSQAEKYTGNTGLELRHMVGLQRAYGESAYGWL